MSGGKRKRMKAGAEEEEWRKEIARLTEYELPQVEVAPGGGVGGVTLR